MRQRRKGQCGLCAQEKLLGEGGVNMVVYGGLGHGGAAAEVYGPGVGGFREPGGAGEQERGEAQQQEGGAHRGS